MKNSTTLSAVIVVSLAAFSFAQSDNAQESGFIKDPVVIPGKGWPSEAIGRVDFAGKGTYDYLFSGGSKSWGQPQGLDIQPRVLNHPNWGGVDTNPRRATFGKVSGKTGERNVQLSLRYSF